MLSQEQLRLQNEASSYPTVKSYHRTQSDSSPTRATQVLPNHSATLTSPSRGNGFQQQSSHLDSWSPFPSPIPKRKLVGGAVTQISSENSRPSAPGIVPRHPLETSNNIPRTLGNPAISLSRSDSPRSQSKLDSVSVFSHGSSSTWDQNAPYEDALCRYAPGKAEHLASKLTGHGYSCPHFPKVRNIHGSRYPSCLGFFHETGEKISFLNLDALCRDCFTEVIPSQDPTRLGYNVWVSASRYSASKNHNDNDPRKKTIWDLPKSSKESYPEMLQSGTENFPSHPSSRIRESRGRSMPPAFLQMPKDEDAIEAWEWLKLSGKPFYIEQLHLFKPRSPWAEMIVEKDLKIVSANGVHYSKEQAKLEKNAVQNNPTLKPVRRPKPGTNSQSGISIVGSVTSSQKSVVEAGTSSSDLVDNRTSAKTKNSKIAASRLEVKKSQDPAFCATEKKFSEPGQAMKVLIQVPSSKLPENDLNPSANPSGQKSAIRAASKTPVLNPSRSEIYQDPIATRDDKTVPFVETSSIPSHSSIELTLGNNVGSVAINVNKKSTKLEGPTSKPNLEPGDSRKSSRKVPSISKSANRTASIEGPISRKLQEKQGKVIETAHSAPSSTVLKTTSQTKSRPKTTNDLNSNIPDVQASTQKLQPISGSPVSQSPTPQPGNQIISQFLVLPTRMQLSTTTKPNRMENFVGNYGRTPSIPLHSPVDITQSYLPPQNSSGKATETSPMFRQIPRHANVFQIQQRDLYSNAHGDHKITSNPLLTGLISISHATGSDKKSTNNFLPLIPRVSGDESFWPPGIDQNNVLTLDSNNETNFRNTDSGIENSIPATYVMDNQQLSKMPLNSTFSSPRLNQLHHSQSFQAPSANSMHSGQAAPRGVARVQSDFSSRQPPSQPQISKNEISHRFGRPDQIDQSSVLASNVSLHTQMPASHITGTAMAQNAISTASSASENSKAKQSKTQLNHRSPNQSHGPFNAPANQAGPERGYINVERNLLDGKLVLPGQEGKAIKRRQSPIGVPTNLEFPAPSAFGETKQVNLQTGYPQENGSAVIPAPSQRKPLPSKPVLQSPGVENAQVLESKANTTQNFSGRLDSGKKVSGNNGESNQRRPKDVVNLKEPTKTTKSKSSEAIHQQQRVTVERNLSQPETQPTHHSLAENMRRIKESIENVVHRPNAAHQAPPDAQKQKVGPQNRLHETSQSQNQAIGGQKEPRKRANPQNQVVKVGQAGPQDAIPKAKIPKIIKTNGHQGSDPSKAAKLSGSGTKNVNKKPQQLFASNPKTRVQPAHREKLHPQNGANRSQNPRSTANRIQPHPNINSHSTPTNSSKDNPKFLDRSIKKKEHSNQNNAGTHLADHAQINRGHPNSAGNSSKGVGSESKPKNESREHEMGENRGNSHSFLGGSPRGDSDAGSSHDRVVDSSSPGLDYESRNRETPRSDGSRSYEPRDERYGEDEFNNHALAAGGIRNDGFADNMVGDDWPEDNGFGDGEPRDDEYRSDRSRNDDLDDNASAADWPEDNGPGDEDSAENEPEWDGSNADDYPPGEDAGDQYPSGDENVNEREGDEGGLDDEGGMDDEEKGSESGEIDNDMLDNEADVDGISDDRMDDDAEWSDDLVSNDNSMDDNQSNDDPWNENEENDDLGNSGLDGGEFGQDDPEFPDESNNDESENNDRESESDEESERPSGIETPEEEDTQDQLWNEDEETNDREVENEQFNGSETQFEQQSDFENETGEQEDEQGINNSESEDEGINEFGNGRYDENGLENEEEQSGGEEFGDEDANEYGGGSQIDDFEDQAEGLEHDSYQQQDEDETQEEDEPDEGSQQEEDFEEEVGDSPGEEYGNEYEEDASGGDEDAPNDGEDVSDEEKDAASDSGGVSDEEQEEQDEDKEPDEDEEPDEEEEQEEEQDEEEEEEPSENEDEEAFDDEQDAASYGGEDDQDGDSDNGGGEYDYD